MGDAAATGIDRDVEMDLVRRAQAGDKRASERLIRAHRGAIFTVVNAWKASRLSPDDLEQEATVGLLEAIRRFDVERGVRLLSYAMVRMEEEVRAFVYSQRGILNLGTTRARVAYRALKKGEDVESVVERTGVSRELVTAVESVIGGRPIDAAEAGLTSPSFEAEVLEADEMSLRRRALSEAIDSLPAQQRRVITATYMSGDDSVSIAEAARQDGLSRARYSAVHLQAIDALRRIVPKAMAETRRVDPAPAEVPVAKVAVPVYRPALSRRHVLRLLRAASWCAQSPAPAACASVVSASSGALAPSSTPARADSMPVSWPPTAVSPAMKPASAPLIASIQAWPAMTPWRVPNAMPSPTETYGSHAFGIGRRPKAASASLTLPLFASLTRPPMTTAAIPMSRSVVLLASMSDTG